MLELALSAFLLTSAADSVTTWQALGRGAREVNPVAASLGGPRVFLSVKSVVAVGVSLAALKQPTRGRRRAVALLLLAGATLQGWAAYHNHRVMR